MLCEWFTFVQECDIPNWLAESIELVIGGSLAIVFFIKQKRQGEKLQKVIDDQEKFRKVQHEFVVQRLRSYLSSLYTTMDSLVKIDYKSNLPVNKKLDKLLEFKKDMITHLDHIVNQSGTILEQDYLEKLDDIIDLSRANPEISHDETKMHMNVSRCSGILSQIDDLLKIIPNPPV
jgi:hypothetical protein